VSCKDIDEIGTKITVNQEIVLCSKENKTVECLQATEGGYYLIGDVLMECSANEEGDQLKCEEIMKEGYFLADGKNVLYECIEKVEEVEISKVNSELYANIDLEGENENPENNLIEENEIELDKRQESEPTVTEKAKTVTEGTSESPTEVPEEPKGPIDVTCKVIECIEGTVVKSGGENSVDLYICKLVEKNDEKPSENSKEENNEEKLNFDGEEDEEEEINKYQWISKDCESGNFLKKDDSYYECEDKKDNIKEEYIEKPNNDKTSTEPRNTVPSTTKTTTTTEEIPISTNTGVATSTTANEQKTTTTKPKPTSSSSTSTNIEKTNKETTTKATTTKTTTTAATTTAGSGASLRSIPSYSS